MSFNLFYDKQFIKVEDEGKTKFVPIIYGGSSNCFEVGRRGRSGRRERSWFGFSYILKGKKFGTLEEMTANIIAERERTIQRNKERNEEYIKEGKADWCDEYSDKRWGYFTGLAIGSGSTHKTTFGNYLGFVTTGCKKALTVEELRNFGVSVTLYTYVFDDDRKKLESLGKQSIYHNVQTSTELVEKIREFENYLEGTGLNLSIKIDADEYTMRKIRNTKFPQKHKTSINVSTLPEHFVVRDVIKGNYILRLTRNGYRYSFNGRAWCKRFTNEKEAQRYAKRACEKCGEEGRFIAEKVVNENFVTA